MTLSNFMHLFHNLTSHFISSQRLSDSFEPCFTALHLPEESLGGLMMFDVEKVMDSRNCWLPEL